MIGVFDSGIGGLSVLNEIRRAAQHADLLYLGDQAKLPYGPRSPEEVEELTSKACNWLVEHGATTLVIACNTASAAALESVRRSHTALPVVGMEPAIKPAAAATKTRRIAVFATEGTFHGGLFQRTRDGIADDIQVMEVSCPEWVGIVEQSHLTPPSTTAAIAEKVAPAVAAGADQAVLACTHFSFLADTIREVGGIDVIDPSPAVARRVIDVGDTTGSGMSRFFTTGKAQRFSEQVRRTIPVDGSVAEVSL